MTESSEQKQDAIGDPMEMFHTREASSEGVRLPLTTPTGAPTEHWLHVIGADSDEFRNAEHMAKRKGMMLGALSDDLEKAKAARELQTELLAVTVKDWSFPKPCTKQNVIEFLRAAPQIADAVDLMVSRRTLFFAKRSIDSLPSLSKSSDST